MKEGFQDVYIIMTVQKNVCILQTGFGVGRPIYSKEFLRNIIVLDFCIFYQVFSF